MKVMVLFSGGLDSTTLLYKARYEHHEVIACSLYYGQKHETELEHAKAITDKLGIPLILRDLTPVFKDSDCVLLKGRGNIPHESYKEQMDKNGEGTVSTYVPFRNGVMLSVAASLALQHGCDALWYGAHRDDAAGRAYPDCTEDFVQYMTQAIREGTGQKVTVQAPWIFFTKADIVSAGLSFGMTQEDFDMTHSCYEGVEGGCGVCATCIDRRKALEANGLHDNTRS